MEGIYSEDMGRLYRATAYLDKFFFFFLGASSATNEASLVVYFFAYTESERPPPHVRHEQIGFCFSLPNQTG